MINVVGCRILVKPLTIEQDDPVIRSAIESGIALPPGDQKRRQASIDKGIVLEIGSGCSSDYISGLNSGDLIGFAKFGGKFFKDNGEDFVVINDEDVICVFKE